MKNLILAATLLFAGLANANPKDDARLMYSLILEAGDAAHVCTTLIDLRQSANLYCDRFRELAYRINAIGYKHEELGTQEEMLTELRKNIDNEFETAFKNMDKAASRLGVEL